MTSLSSDFFNGIALNQHLRIASADDVWNFLNESMAGGWSAGGTVVYRGQSSASHSLSSSLYRLCRTVAGDGVRITEAHLATAERAVLASARGQGLGRRMTDGELLMVLQHHGIPTRLIDVSLQPMEALFFAVAGNDGAPGRLFVIDYQDDELSLAAASAYGPAGQDERQLPWAEQAKGTRSTGEWSETVAPVVDAPLDPRMRAQLGKFLVGGLNVRNAGRSIRIAGGRAVPPEEYANISTLGINFLRQRRKTRHKNWSATGWVLNIAAPWKAELRARLGDLDDKITHDTMYPPHLEVRRLAIEDAKRVLAPNI